VEIGMAGWLTLFYIYCGLLVAAYFLVYRLMHRPRFRDEHGDITTEVGYEEDSIGRPFHGNDEEYVDPEVPHGEPIGQTEMGML
jgi:hypothetical protein